MVHLGLAAVVVVSSYRGVGQAGATESIVEHRVRNQATGIDWLGLVLRVKSVGERLAVGAVDGCKIHGITLELLVEKTVDISSMVLIELRQVVVE